MVDFNSRNITPEAIESSGRKHTYVSSSSTFDTKNYLDVKLNDNEVEKKLIIRLLPVSKDTNSPFQHIHMHTVSVPKDISANGFKSYVCLNKTRGKYTEALGTKCPFCDERSAAYNNFVKEKEAGNNEIAEQWKKKSLSLIPNEASIIRCIERGKENEGVKFWKFNLRSDKMDPENQILKLYNDKKEECEIEHRPIENILDLMEGYDLKVTISRVFDKEGRPTKKTTTSISVFGSKKPLSTDMELVGKWINDEKIWSDVFVAKPYDYCSIIIEGDIPWYNRETGKWIKKMDVEEYKKMKQAEKEQKESELDKEIKAAEAAINNVDTPSTAPMPETPNDFDDDLPF